MRQRVAFLRTLLAGKPRAAAGRAVRRARRDHAAELQGWLAEALDAEPRTVVLVTHDVDEALRICERVVALSPRPGPSAATRPAAELGRDDVMEALRS